ncbi:MAG TPA: hypothetical protein VF270_01830 [Ignavibacteriaceae bacterium]
MIKKIFLALISVSTILLLIGCNDSPSDLGIGFLPQDGIEVLKLDSSVDSIPQQSNSFKKVVNLGNSDQLLLGKAQNVTANTLMRFAFVIPDSIKSEIEANNLTVLDSYVEMTKNYIFGDSSAVFDYQVHKINSGWSSSTFTADSFATLSYDNNDVSTNRSTSNDTTYSFHLENTLASSWLKNYVDTSLASNNGIVLTPTENTNKVLGFTAFNVSGINDPRMRVVVQKPGAYTDTLVGYIAVDVSVVLGDIPNTGNENLSIQSSLTSEGKLWFDLSVLPSGATISSAKLTLTLDTLQTKTGSDFTNSLSVYLFSDSAKREINTNYLYALNRSGSTFTGTITNIVRAWNNNVDNQGMLIRATGEQRGVEIFAIKGSNSANVLQRPKLEIVYSRKK